MGDTRRSNRCVRLGLLALTAIAISAMAAVAWRPGGAWAAKLPPPVIGDKMPYPSKYVEVLGSRMHYVEAGHGDPIVFLHGQPTSSYLWRNIMPYLEPLGLVIAPDNIGFGKSDKPDIDYTYADHMRYIDGFIAALNLKNITFVIHDWGSALGFDYAERNRTNVIGIAFMESIVPPGLPAPSYEAMGPLFEKFFRTLRDPVTGPELMIKQNHFVEVILPSFVNRDLTEAEMAFYRAPFPDEASRKPINMWPNQVPIGGEPAHTTDVVNRYNKWLLRTTMPMILLYASPGALNPPESAQWLAANMRNLETVYIGQGMHYVQEDQPDAIGRGIADWYRRNFQR